MSTPTPTADTSAPAKARRVVPSPTLHVASGPAAGTTIRLEEDGTLGRRSDNTYCLDHPSVSRVHAEITRQAAFIAYIDDFWIMMWLTFASIPLVLLLKPGSGQASGKPAPAMAD